ncbi:MAG: polysaccharide deacetylase family protein [Candidatus Hydrogenedentes bacterium]|nr:polysaccharide deacetylase family protein [Candidatus Hydrogenedentota bacterium]
MSTAAYYRRVSAARALRETVQAAAHVAQLDSLLAALRNQHGAVILTYHSVARAESADYIDHTMRMTSAHFERQVALLARQRRVISLSEIVETLVGGKTPPRGSVAITFDDGYLDTLEVAAPVLGSLGLPAVVFLPTAYIDTGETHWLDALWNIFRTACRRVIMIDDQPVDCRRGAAVARAYAAYKAQLLSATPTERRAILCRLAAELRADPTTPRLTMTWKDVRQLASRYPRMAVGGHSRGHTDLAALPRALCVQEVTACRDDIKAATGKEPAFLSYPYNRTSAIAREAVAGAGFVAALSSADEFVVAQGCDLMNLPRIDASVSAALLGYLTSGAARRLSWRRGM